MYRPKMFKEAEKSTASDNIIVNILVFIGIFFLIMIAESIIPAIVMRGDMKELVNSGVLDDVPSLGKIMSMTTEIAMKPFTFFVTLLCTGFGTLLSMFYCRFIEARHLRSMGFRKEKALSHYGLGLLVGILLMTAIVLVSLIVGINRISLCSDINFGLIGLFLIGFFVQGMSEEVIFRGYLMTTVGSRHGTIPAVIVSACAFSLAHLLNPGFNLLVFFNLAMFGVFAALYMIRFDNIWGVCGIHSIWNFTQGSFYGISVSGTGDMASVFRTTAKSSHSLLTGGDFGIEGSLVTTIMLCAGSVLLFMLIKKMPETTE